MLTYEQIKKAARLMEQCGEIPQIEGVCGIASRYLCKTRLENENSEESSQGKQVKIVFGINPKTGEEEFYRIFPDDNGEFPKDKYK